jgi:hypothetical protein
MKYIINDIIKRLTEVQKEGKTLITESELIRIATPKINRIDAIITQIDKAIETKKNSRFPFYDVSFTEVGEYHIVSRQTLYRWVNKDIVKVNGYGLINLFELKKTILNIKKIHETHE